MTGFIVRRLVVGVVALFVAISGSFLFFASRFYPLSRQPLLHAYWQWLSRIPTGRSLTHGIVDPTLLSDISSAFGRTVLLLAVTLVLVVVTAVPIACVGALMRGSALDFLLRGFSYVAWSVPAFVLGLYLQTAVGRAPFGPGLGWFPTGGWAGECPNQLGVDPVNIHCPSAGTGIAQVGHVLYHLALPAATLAFGFIAVEARYLRNSLLDAMAQPHIVVARGKGLSEKQILLRHAIPNAVVTFVPAVISDIGAMFGGALAVDWVFQLGGLGTKFVNLLSLSVDGVIPIDTYAIQLCLLFAAVFMLVVTIAGEAVVWRLDPRVRSDRG